MRRVLSVALFGGLLLASCVEDGTREIGESCWEDADCDGADLWCEAGTCALWDPSDAEGGGAYITCKDGTKSPTCTTCSSGCCSGHGGCAD